MTSDIYQKRLERRVLLLMALAQFVNIWDFMIVMPLGPDFARALGIDSGHIGWVTGSYSFAAAFSGVLAAKYLDRFDRKSALCVALGALSLVTALCALAGDLFTLILARMLAGLCGGPVMALSLSILSDVFPESRRGQAMGKVMGSFSLAAVLGVPLGLELARLGDWWLPFVAVAAMGVAVMLAIHRILPPMRGHLSDEGAYLASFARVFRNARQRLPLLGFLMVATSLSGMFMIIPNVSAHVQLNLGYPREKLGLLYLVGGVVAFASMRISGRAVDRYGATAVTVAATAGLLLALYFGFYMPLLPAMAIFVLFMLSSSARNITSNTLASKIPPRHERAGFMSLLSAVASLSQAAGAFVASMMLYETPDGRLEGMEAVTLCAMTLVLAMPLLTRAIERALAERARES